MGFRKQSEESFYVTCEAGGQGVSVDAGEIQDAARMPWPCNPNDNVTFYVSPEGGMFAFLRYGRTVNAHISRETWDALVKEAGGAGNLKETTGKRRWHLLPWLGAESVVRVMEHGADKYAPDNWRGHMETDKYLDAIQRHAQRIRAGEWIDPDSGEPHTSHIAAIGMMMTEDRNEERD